MRAALLALLLLLPATAPIAAAGPPDGGVQCGNVSPLGNSCVAGTIVVTPQLDVEVVVLGFVGRLQVELRQTFVIDERTFVFVYTYTCDVYGSALLATCTEAGWVFPWFPAVVTCRASAVTVAPPIGPWSCEVTN